MIKFQKLEAIIVTGQTNKIDTHRQTKSVYKIKEQIETLLQTAVDDQKVINKLGRSKFVSEGEKV